MNHSEIDQVSLELARRVAEHGGLQSLPGGRG